VFQARDAPDAGVAGVVGGGKSGLVLALTLILAAAVLSPALTFGFFGDDFDLWLAGKELQRNVSLLLIGPSNFYRPANTMLFAVHDLVFGPNPLGYHMTVMALHLLCGWFIWRILERHGLPPLARAAASFAWLTSPYTFEPLWAVNVAYNDLTVCAVWLGLVAHWPEERWSPGRGAALAGAVLFSVFCKESWVVVPGLVVILELTIRRASLRTAAVTGCIAAAPVAVYLAAYVAVFGDRFGGSYTSGGLEAWLKVPHAWGAFWGLTRLVPMDFPFGVGEAAGVLVLVACVALAVGRTRDPLMTLGLTLFGLPFLPILAAPWLPPRYTTVPFAGFVLAFVALAAWLIRSTRFRSVTIASVTLVVALLVGRQLVLLRGDVHDISRLDEAHRQLVAEAEEGVSRLSDADLMLCLRLDPSSPMGMLAATEHRGHRKVYFFRADAPHDLINWEALVTFAQARIGVDAVWARVDEIPETPTDRWIVVAHRGGRIIQLHPQEDGPRLELEAWRERGVRTRTIALQ
jgi:hypothetical protein